MFCLITKDLIKATKTPISLLGDQKSTNRSCVVFAESDTRVQFVLLLLGAH